MRRAALIGLAAVSCGAPIRHPADTDAAPSSTGGTTNTTTSDESSTGSETDPPTSTTEPETDTEDPSTTTGPTCSESIPCVDPEAPFCVEGTCTTCDAAEDPDAACLELDEAAPVCVGDACVQCSSEDASACGGTTPLCDDASNTCVACRFHEECQDIDLPACNIATGACFSNDAVTEVNAGTPGELQAAVTDVAAGSEHTIVVTGSGGTNHTVTVDSGKTIAFVSTNMEEQEVRGNSGNPTLTVTGTGTTVYLHRLALTLNGNDVGISVESSGTLYADSTRVAQNTGGGIELASGTSGFLRNCMVAGVAGNPGMPAVSANSATLEVLFSTLGLGFNSGGSPVECSGGSVSIRNSIVVNESNTAGSEVNCPGSAIDTSALRTTLSPTDWFGGFASGNYSLTAAGQTEFADEAVWENGDPPFDFDGDARPATDGANDYPGADVP